LKLPPTLLTSLQNLPGFDEPAFIESHQASRQITSIRINPLKFNVRSAKFGLEDRVPWSGHGYYLRQRPLFTVDPLFHAGAYYVQDASSMFLEEAVRQSCDLTQPLRVLDLCAAPGGKSTLVQSLISENSLLVSNEVIKTRANILVENITKWGAPNVVVTNNDPKDFQRLPGFFDLIVVDAPCSGSGLFRKDPAAMEEWNINNVALCSQRQQKILADVMEALKPGGILVYSTCSYSLEEDEEIGDWLAEKFAMVNVQLKIETSWGIVETRSARSGASGYRFYPDKVSGEGFFITVFRKEEGRFTSKEIKSRVKPGTLMRAELEIVRAFIQKPENYSFIKWNNEILAIRESLYESFLQLQAGLYIKKAGVKLGTLIRNELVPDHELVLSTIVAEKFTNCQVEEQTALDFLRRRDIKINTDAKGWTIINYENIPLGLVKILPNRINNYYPKEWRILNK
jgi:16S rRNA C967 or C1407 C5-methylase (RsmB/RsmF family)/NOL1/NOP2/fmu family ribosome biogenesis protein